MFSIARYSSCSWRSGGAAVLRAAIGEHAAQRDAVRLEERDDAVVDEVRRRERRLRVVELRERHLAVRVDERLLVDAPHALERPHAERVLRAAVLPGHSLSNSPCASLSAFAFSSAATWASARMTPSWATFASSALSRFFVVSRSCRAHTHRTPAGEMTWPTLRISFATRTCPRVGCSIASATTAASIAGATRSFSSGWRFDISCSATSPACSHSRRAPARKSMPTPLRRDSLTDSEPRRHRRACTRRAGRGARVDAVR